MLHTKLNKLKELITIKNKSGFVLEGNIVNVNNNSNNMDNTNGNINNVNNMNTTNNNINGNNNLIYGGGNMILVEDKLNDMIDHYKIFIKKPIDLFPKTNKNNECTDSNTEYDQVNNLANLILELKKELD